MNPQSAAIPHFLEDPHLNIPTLNTPPRLLPANVYGTALDALVLTCVDIAFLQGARVLLGKRNTYPRKDWWLIGGRMWVGESPVATAQRKAHQEAGLDLEQDRFVCIGVYSSHFSLRSQPPQANGAHTVNLTYTAELPPAEATQISLDPSEYDEWQWVEIDAIANLLTAGNQLDQYLLRVIADVKQHQVDRNAPASKP